VIYYDGSSTTRGLAINLAENRGRAWRDGGQLHAGDRAAQTGGTVAGFAAEDRESGTEHEISRPGRGQRTGVFTDQILRMDDPGAPPCSRSARGPTSCSGRSSCPETRRSWCPRPPTPCAVRSAVARQGGVGTTDTPVAEPSMEPRALPRRSTSSSTMPPPTWPKDPTRADVLSVFAGLRPLVTADDEAATAKLSRDHSVHVSQSGLVTITGGKWTTYRRMAKDVVDQAAMVPASWSAPAPPRACASMAG